ncbi:hypothetical protein UC8_20300 [Roseimaritima ulvae]|uniref:DUF6798 domain-containing protein n=2 Tax=Roseimaritima ulvae TaxID=980254 RepID=A0A5B9QSK8_9BACT|nr:hypothetical protein UC8_20300 [Roseimaritima ulvae]
MLSAASCSWRWRSWEIWLILMVFVFYAGDPAPAINEAHYLAKAKNFWQPQWCAGDLFVTSGKAHTTFYWVFGWLTNFFSLATTAWIGRLVGWSLLAVGLQRFSWSVVPVRYASLLAAFIWLAGIEHGNLAGEWVVGGIEAKVPAYGFVLLALERMVRGHWKIVWPLLGAASAFHVLVGGWSVLCGGLVWLTAGKSRGSLVSQILPLAIGGGIALFGLLPAIWLTEGTSEADAIAAARTYVYQRIPHHLLPADFAPSWYLRHGLLIAMTMIVFAIQKTDQRIRAVGWFTVGAVLLAGIGLLLGLLPQSHPDLAAKWLRFYWFRLTDAAVPLALALATVRLLAVPSRWGRGLGWALAGLLGLIAVLLVARHSLQKAEAGLPASCDLHSQGHFPDTSVAERQAVCRAWIDACDWIRDNTDPDAVFLTPRHQQTFKWYANRAEVVNYKDVPQDVPNLKEWQSRFDRVFPPELGRIRITIQYSELQKFRKQYGADYMVVDRRIAPYSMPLQKVYPTALESNEYYAVYRLP